MSDRVTKHINQHIDTIRLLTESSHLIETIAQAITRCLRQNGKILWMGNGGSAADCQHMAAEFVGRFEQERKGLASIALTTDTSILTSVGNDYGFEKIFSRQIESLCNNNDIVIGISTSGNSRNILEGFKKAQQAGAYTIGFTGNDGGLMAAQVDTCIIVPSNNTARIQEAHILIGHIICTCVETDYFG
jgi:D-sedoheptulose 7-phosphate isomerase